MTFEQDLRLSSFINNQIARMDEKSAEALFEYLAMWSVCDRCCLHEKCPLCEEVVELKNTGKLSSTPLKNTCEDIIETYVKTNKIVDRRYDDGSREND